MFAERCIVLFGPNVLSYTIKTYHLSFTMQIYNITKPHISVFVRICPLISEFVCFCPYFKKDAYKKMYCFVGGFRGFLYLYVR